jgi:hypothetical protein
MPLQLILQSKNMTILVLLGTRRTQKTTNIMISGTEEEKRNGKTMNFGV